MGYKENINKVKPEMEKVINFLSQELAVIRTDRASPSLVENVMIDCYGQKMPLKQLATISLSGPRQILILPWDRAMILFIERTILESGLGINPVVEKDSIRLSLPPLSEEYRKDLLRTLSEKLEESRVKIRHWREEVWREIQDGFRQGKIREDDKFRAKDDLQEIIDEYNEKIEEIGERKKKEIME
jgi:ribosome recycling factor